MTVEEAIPSALDFEHRVRDHYARAAERTTDKNANRIFATMAIEEQIHVDHLKTVLDIWRKVGKIDWAVLKTSLPDKEWIEQGWDKITRVKLKTDFKDELEMLKGAVELELSVSDHYAQLVKMLDGEAQKMFNRFQKIEENHLAIVKAIVETIERDNALLELPSGKID